MTKRSSVAQSISESTTTWFFEKNPASLAAAMASHLPRALALIAVYLLDLIDFAIILCGWGIGFFRVWWFGTAVF